MEDYIMSFFNWLFSLGRNSRYSRYGRDSRCGDSSGYGYSKHGNSSKHGERYREDDDCISQQNHEVNRQYQKVTKCSQCRAILSMDAKFCSECGLENR